MTLWAFPVLSFLLVMSGGAPSFASLVATRDGEEMVHLISVATSAHGSLLTAPGSFSYTANALNQYTKRTVPGAVDVSGTAATNATVTVNGQAVSRQGDYFWKELSINNSAGAACPQVTATAAGVSSTNLIAEASGKVFLSKNPERFAYDADGNLTSDGRFSYGWDAENRLIAMETISSVPTDAKKKLEFTYDWQGRRIDKKVFAWDGGSGFYSLTAERKFVYDSWNLLAEINANNILIRNYTWGLDLSGSIQGAGGVGGLLFIGDGASAISYASAHDGNGNVVALVSTATGALSAEYEYSPFGDLIRSNDPFAKSNPFRFSTKYFDAETGLGYWGFRYEREGRWLSRDLIGELGGWNLYAYCGNDGVNGVDPFGLFERMESDTGGAAYLRANAWYEVPVVILANTLSLSNNGIRIAFDNIGDVEEVFGGRGARGASAFAFPPLALEAAPLRLIGAEAQEARMLAGVEVPCQRMAVASQNAVFNNIMRDVEIVNVSTPRNGAVFWTGYKQGNQAAAMEWAAANGKYTLEMTPGGQWLNKLNLYGPNSPLTPAQADAAWLRISERFTEGASGRVSAFTRGTSYGPVSTFYNAELPGLRINPDVNPTITYRGY